MQGNDVNTATQLLKQAESLEKSDTQALVLECIPQEAAKFITKKSLIPVIGIDVGLDCNDQVLVLSRSFTIWRRQIT